MKPSDRTKYSLARWLHTVDTLFNIKKARDSGKDTVQMMATVRSLHCLQKTFIPQLELVKG